MRVPSAPIDVGVNLPVTVTLFPWEDVEIVIEVACLGFFSMFKMTSVEWVFPPPEPWIVMVYLSSGVFMGMLIVRVEEKASFSEAGLKLATIPLGSREAVRVTVRSNPSMLSTWIL
ncbi:MAG: hypothetical protein QW542_06365 [Thermoproteota archaeon]